MDQGVLTVLSAVLLLGPVVYGNRREPECSRFHYEEQLLEKMIRTELQFEEMQKSVSNNLKEMKDALESLQVTNEKFIQDKTAEIAAQKDSVTNALRELESTKEEVLIPNILFKARTVADLQLDNGEKIIFTEIMNNHGNGYDSATGIFTAPVKGTYIMTVHLCTYHKKYIHYGIVVEDTSVTRGVGYDGPGAYACTSADAIVVLKASDKVWIQSFNNGDQLYQDVSRWNTFSGVLLHK